MQYKVMTTEEKAKAYDEALGRAKEKYAMFEGMKQGDVLEDVFPELKVSEDERIRKRIYNYINVTLDDNESAEKEKWLAWLEKQGEQKPFDYENANIQQKDFASQVDMPRYSIGDVLCDKSCTTLNKESQPNFEIIDIRNGMYICDKCSFPISQQDEYELVAKRIEQNSAWSEEDALQLNEAIEAVNESSYSSERKDAVIDWLKSIKGRYTWKPSDEQIKVCKEVYADLLSARGFDVGSVNREIKRLEEQLKKKLKG